MSDRRNVCIPCKGYGLVRDIVCDHCHGTGGSICLIPIGAPACNYFKRGGRAEDVAIKRRQPAKPLPVELDVF